MKTPHRPTPFWFILSVYPRMPLELWVLLYIQSPIDNCNLLGRPGQSAHKWGFHPFIIASLTSTARTYPYKQAVGGVAFIKMTKRKHQIDHIEGKRAASL